MISRLMLALSLTFLLSIAGAHDARIESSADGRPHATGHREFPPSLILASARINDLAPRASASGLSSLLFVLAIAATRAHQADTWAREMVEPSGLHRPDDRLMAKNVARAERD